MPALIHKPARAGDRAVLSAFSLASTLMVLLAVAGGIRTYSSIPFWDMWDGYLNFYMEAAKGDWSAWWTPHNEHRIVWSRVLFWLDIRWFGGAGAFLIAMNYVLAGITGLVFCRLLAWSMPDPNLRLPRWSASLFIMGWMFLWCQSENFTWGFQSQFFLAALLPLCALVALYRSAEPNAGRGIYAGACLLGVASLGTMANGVIVLPVMVLAAALLRMSLLRILILLAVAAGGIAVYFHASASPAHANGDSMLAVVLAHPLEIIRNLLVYLGSPFFYLMRKSSHSVQIAAGAGAVLVAASVVWGVVAAWRGRQAGLRLALLCYLLFIGGTALATAIGRLQYGPDQILSSRYSTPAVMAWAAFMVLLADSLKVRMQVRAFGFVLPLFALFAYATLVQARNFPPAPTTEPDRKLASLALAVGARDDIQIGFIYPFIDHVIGIAERAAQAELSIFGSPPLLKVRAQLGTSATMAKIGDCQARVDYVLELPAGDYNRISGWVRGAGVANEPGVWLSDSQGRRVGYALVSSPSSLALANAGVEQRYEGYVLKAAASDLQSVQVDDAGCAATLAPASPRLAATTENVMAINGREAAVDAILVNRGWNGADYEQSTLDGLQVVGSHVRNDADTGTLRMKVKSGESIFYRSGQQARSQFLLIGDDASMRVMLPWAKGWIRLEFPDAVWSGAEYEITFTDAGTGIGEWSAVALRRDK